MSGIAKGAFRLFHLGAHGVQVVAGRDYRKQQNECAAESAKENELGRCRTSDGTSQSSPTPPQQPRGQQQREPTEVKKKLHTIARDSTTITGATA